MPKRYSPEIRRTALEFVNQVPGVMRLYLALRQQGLSVGFKRLRRLFRSNGIFHRKYIATTDSNHYLARLPNLIDRQFNRYAINQAWCGDITYIPTDEGWLFIGILRA